MEGRIHLSGVAAAVSILLGGISDVASQEAFSVVGLRMSKVTLYRDCNMDKGMSFSREDFEKRKPLRATTDPKTAVYYWVRLDGVDYCVKAFAVETDRVVPVVKDAECQTRVAGRPPKTGAVRGIGEGCESPGSGLPVAVPGGEHPPGPPAGTPGNRPARGQ
jgi:hypothetical protein